MEDDGNYLRNEVERRKRFHSLLDELGGETFTGKYVLIGTTEVPIEDYIVFTRNYINGHITDAQFKEIITSYKKR